MVEEQLNANYYFKCRINWLFGENVKNYKSFDIPVDGQTCMTYTTINSDHHA